MYYIYCNDWSIFFIFIVLKDAVHLLTVSQDGQYIVAADHRSNIVVWTTDNLKVKLFVFHCISVILYVGKMASFHRQLLACFPPLASQVCTSVTLCWFCGAQIGFWIGFSLGFSHFPLTTNFIPPFLHTRSFCFITFHEPLWWCDRRGRLAPLL